MHLTTHEKVSVLAASLWGTKGIDGDARLVAIDQQKELERMGYDIIKRRYDTKGLA